MLTHHDIEESVSIQSVKACFVSEYIHSFFVLLLAGKPKRADAMQSLCLMLGPDFITDILEVIIITLVKVLRISPEFRILRLTRLSIESQPQNSELIIASLISFQII